MRHLSEYRDPDRARALLDAIAARSRRPLTLMEICGGQTHNLLKDGIDRLLPDTVELLHGPGCPVCVTPAGLIDQAILAAQRPEVTLVSFGDMLRVPGSRTDLLAARASGGDVRVVYSPLDAVTLAQEHPERQVVFFAIGFETTAPATAMAAVQAQELGLENFSLLCAHVLVPPAVEAILQADDVEVQAFLAPGHVCAITVFAPYEEIATSYRVPIVVTGFEPTDLLEGVLAAVEAHAEGRFGVENRYRRAVSRAGNTRAWALVERVFEVCDRRWRGLGEIPLSGLRLRAELAHLDAARKLELAEPMTEEPAACRAGEVLRGALRPSDCAAFGAECTPEHPLGAPMVSAEGACAAYHRYRRDG